MDVKTCTKDHKSFKDQPISTFVRSIVCDDDGQQSNGRKVLWLHEKACCIMKQHINHIWWTVFSLIM